MSTIVPHYKNIQTLLQSQFFAIDEYQREYKWGKENVEALLSDLVDKFCKCYQKGDVTTKVGSYEDYFLGSIIVSRRNNKNFLIDGQQRVTTLTLLLIYLYRAAKDKQLGVTESIAPLIYSDNLGEPNFNLDITERLPVIEALFNGTDFNPEGKEESVQTMFARYNDITARDLAGELDEGLPHFIYWLIKKVGLIEISTDNDNYAYAIFETMNDRGKPLSPVDMLKAFLLAPIDDVDHRRQANQIWKKQVLDLISWGGEHEPERDANCIKAWLRAQHADEKRETKANSTDKDWELAGSTFHRWVRDKQAKLNLGTSAQNLQLISKDFPFFAKAYQKILDASRTFTPGLEAIFYNAHNEFTWQNTVLLAPLRVGDDEETVRRKLAATATYLDIWVMRRAANYVRVGYSSTAHAMFNLCKEIRRKTLHQLVEVLTKKLAKDEVTFEGYPAKQRTGIEGLALNQFSKRYIFHLLARLSAFTEVGAGKPNQFAHYVDRSVTNPFDIEHIWANDYSQYKNEFHVAQDFQEFRNHVGGLLLLPADVNRSLQDKPYKSKLSKYAQQNFYAASLAEKTYENQPKFKSFRAKYKLSFKPFITFKKSDQLERRILVKELVNLVWSPERLKEFLP